MAFMTIESYTIVRVWVIFLDKFLVDLDENIRTMLQELCLFILKLNICYDKLKYNKNRKY